jgi:bifunctional ADP-heptose synthase (sugar kinase/adenylyltransferase)
VFDVSGAGDTVIATLRRNARRHAAVGRGNSRQSGREIVVGKLGTAVVSPQELLEALAQN